MIHIKIYDKGHDEMHIYAKIKCPADQRSAQLGALLIATCNIVRDAMTDLDKDAFLRMMDRAWDMEAKRSESET